MYKINNSLSIFCASFFRRVMVILELDVLKRGSEVGIRIGNPVTFEDGLNNSSEKSNKEQPEIQPPNKSAPLLNLGLNKGMHYINVDQLYVN